MRGRRGHQAAHGWSPLLEAHRVDFAPLPAVSLPPDLSLAHSLILERPQILEAGLRLLDRDVPVPGAAPVPLLGQDGLGRPVLIELDTGDADRTFLCGLDHLSWLEESHGTRIPSPRGDPLPERRMFFVLEHESPDLVRRLGQVRGTWFKLFVVRCFDVAQQTCVALETYASLGEGQGRNRPLSPPGSIPISAETADPDHLKMLEDDALLNEEERAAFRVEPQTDGAES